MFTIGANGSIYTKVPLDRELRSQYDVVVEASDGAVDPRRTTLTLSVLVTDVDDNSPVFTQETYVVSVPENSPVGTVVLKLSVSTFCVCVCFHYFSHSAVGLHCGLSASSAIQHDRFSECLINITIKNYVVTFFPLKSGYSRASFRLDKLALLRCS